MGVERFGVFLVRQKQRQRERRSLCVTGQNLELSNINGLCSWLKTNPFRYKCERRSRPCLLPLSVPAMPRNGAAVGIWPITAQINHCIHSPSPLPCCLKKKEAKEALSELKLDFCFSDLGGRFGEGRREISKSSCHKGQGRNCRAEFYSHTQPLPCQKVENRVHIEKSNLLSNPQDRNKPCHSLVVPFLLLL